ncbi:MAG: asparagine synthase (glutamine-hydrolyzing) [candidate division Zixibacteria bacterium]|nr:asparagine synthase (glutamine-hydrolyzing) [candidate division Zixibacteria bacterium]
MCGICGIVYKENNRPVEQSLLERMTDSIRHRGPDDSGYYRHGNVGLGHRRLSIVDVVGGRQPLANENDSLWIAYNGEIYNHLMLRRDLEKRGHRYKTHCDTETVLHAFEEYGTESFCRLRGMFAFAIFDENRQKLSLVRDRIGIKPLYYVDTPAFFAFASEIKSLLEIEELKRTVDYHALLQVLALKYTTDDSTLFAGIRKLEPGYYLELKRGALSITKYYDFHDIKVDSSITESDAIARFRELFDESVNLRLMADVPLGMFLSGGIDSTVIASRMAAMVNRPISTFSVAFAEREANELYYARQAATWTKSDHHEITMTPEDFFDLLPCLIYHEDEPIAHPSSLALNVVAQLAAKHVKVVLTGEGADELFGGYERYYQTLYNLKADQVVFGVLPRFLRKGFFRPLINLLPYKFPYRNKAVRTFLYLNSDLETIFLDNYSTFSRHQLGALMAGASWQGADPQKVYAGFNEYFNRYRQDSLLGRILYADMKTYLLELLMKQDQMSMAASIESRVPFLDQELIEFAFSLPDSLKIKRFNTKRILRLAFGDQIPPEILTRPKAGFPVPIEKWFAGDYHKLARRLVLGKESFCGEICDRREVEKYFTRHRQGKYNYADQIWTLVNLELWHRIFIQRQAPDSIRLEAA